MTRVIAREPAALARRQTRAPTARSDFSLRPSSIRFDSAQVRGDSLFLYWWLDVPSGEVDEQSPRGFLFLRRHIAPSGRVLCSQQGWPMAEIVDARPRRGVLGSLRCVVESLFKLRPTSATTAHCRCRLRRGGAGVAHLGAATGRADAQLRGQAAGSHARYGRDIGHGRPGRAQRRRRDRPAGRQGASAERFTQREVDDGSYAARLEAFGTAVRAAKDSKSVVRPATLSPQAV